jgi:hypothetical protein
VDERGPPDRLLAVPAERRRGGGRLDRGAGLVLADRDPLRRAGLRAGGTVNATLADRDRITADDYVTVLLSTFDDARQAVAFAVNPLGVQMDGTLVETGSMGGGGS